MTNNELRKECGLKSVRNMGCHLTGWSEEDSLESLAQGKPCGTLREACFREMAQQGCMFRWQLLGVLVGRGKCD